ncbi:hypothetical protein ACFOY4_36965 [Actinomadura syzygii]|uniref:hypothetical protein n=1 Tax=Actinomadura syzygii TaxID=1427538 RepID=UPI0016522583|nr:hypothetical protein [Actinomadura syzygii]
MFFVNVPLAGAAALLAFVLIAPDAPRAGGRSMDVAGALTSTIGITAVVFALVQGPESGWLSPAVLATALAGAVLFAVFVVVERRSADPLLPLRLFTNRDLSVGTLVTFLYMGTFGTLLYFLTVYFQGVHGYDALTTGLATARPCTSDRHRSSVVSPASGPSWLRPKLRAGRMSPLTVLALGDLVSGFDSFAAMAGPRKLGLDTR